jgi:hypothetical protein
LVRSIQISPSETVERIANEGRLEILTSVTNTEAGGFLLDRVVSGRALMNPHVDNWLHFAARTSGGPEAARAVEVYVNGIPMRVDSFATGNDNWTMKVKCGPDMLAAKGYWVDWDVVVRPEIESQVWIANLLVSESAEAPAPTEPFEEKSLKAGEPIGNPQRGASSSVESHTQEQSSLSYESDESYPQDREETLVTAKALPEGSDGFHGLEYTPKGTAFRWTGPGPESRFTMWTNRNRPVVLTFRIISLGNNHPGDLTIEVDGEIYPLRESKRSDSAVEAGPLRAQIGDDPTFVTLRVSHLVQPSGGGAADQRTLGVALAWIRAETAEAL